MTRRATRSCWAPALGLTMLLLAMPAGGRDLRDYRTGFVLAKQERFVEAAESWYGVAERLGNASAATEPQRTSAVGFVLSAIAFELAGDARAYGAWARAIEVFLRARTRWEDERAALAARREEIESLFSALSPDADAGAVDGETLFFLELDDEIGLLTYAGPGPGLAEQPVPAEPRPQEETRAYFARPLSVIERQQGDTPYTDPADAPADVAAAVQRRAPAADAVAAEPGETLARSAPRPQRGVVVTDPRPLPPSPPPVAAPPPPPASVDPPETSVTTAVRGQGLVSAWSLNEADREQARLAWRYVQENLQANTGLVNGLSHHPRITLWEVGSALAALVAAEQLQLVPGVRFRSDVERLLVTLEGLPLFDQSLPNIEYDTETGRMVDAHGRPSDRGMGWSALDIGRALVWLRILHDGYPDHREAVQRVIGRWQLARLVGPDGLLRGRWVDGGVETVQQGRFGYEHYAAAGLAAWDVSAPTALDLDDVAFTELLGVTVPHDRRPGAFLTSEPFMLIAMELGGLNAGFARFIDAVYRVQKQRYEQQDVLSAISEDALTRPPWFVYNTVLHDGKPWQALGPDGRPQPDLAGLSTKAAFAWSALYDDAFSRALAAAARTLTHERIGFLAGRFDDGAPNPTLSLNTNAVVLEALLFKYRRGEPFLRLVLGDDDRPALRRP